MLSNFINIASIVIHYQWIAGQGKSLETLQHGSFNKYFMYTRDNPREPTQILPTLASVANNSTIFRPYTAVIVHGHEGSGFSSLNPVVKDAFLNKEDINVIVVDWSVYAEQSYSNAVSAVPGVGVALAEFIQLLLDMNRVSLDRLHLVGFNLGAHVIGFTGRSLDGQTARITGLDPVARQWGSNTERLRATDARYVEVIHTDGDGLIGHGLGTAIGHVDFFLREEVYVTNSCSSVSGGSNQPGCLFNACSQNRAWELFAATQTHDHLVGKHCATSTQLSLNMCRGYALPMGNNDLVKYGSGIFRVNTLKSYPY